MSEEDEVSIFTPRISMYHEPFDSCLELCGLVLRDMGDISDLEEFVSDRTPFRSVIDMMFCGLFPQMMGDCLAYYEGEGGSLSDIYAKAKIKRIDVAIAAMIPGIVPSIVEQPMCVGLLFPHIAEIAGDISTPARVVATHP